MASATRYHALRSMILVVGVSVATLIGSKLIERSNAAREADSLVRQLLNAETAQVPGILAEMRNYRLWANPLLWQAYANSPHASRMKLHASLALLSLDPRQVEY